MSDPAASTVTAGDDRFSAYHIVVVLLIALSIVFDGFDTYTLGLTVPAIAADWGVPPSAFATMTALATAATLAGSVLAGFVGDAVGRKLTLVLATILYGGGSLVSAVAPDMLILGISRFVTGIGLGAAVVTSIVAVAEHVPLRQRSAAITMTTLGIPLGHTLAGVTASLVLEPFGWRSLFLIGAAVPAVMLILQLLFLPETPSFMRGKERYRTALDRYYRRTGMVPPVEEPVTIGPAPKRSGNRASALFSPELRFETMFLWTGMTASVFITHVSSQWLPSLISHTGGSLTLASQAIVYFGIGQIAGVFLAAPLIYWYGSRRPMLAGAIGIGILALILAARFDANPTTIATFAMFGVMALLGSQMVALHHALGPAIYPETIRGTGTGLALAIGKSGAIISSFAGAWSLQYGGTAFFGLIALAAVVQFACFGMLRRHALSGRRGAAATH